MSFSVTVTPGKQFASTETVTIPKLNQLGQPTFTVTGTGGTTDLANGAVTAPKTVADNHFFAQGGATAAASVLGNGVDTSRKYTLAWGTNAVPGTPIDGMIISFKMPEDHAGPFGMTIDTTVGGEKRARKNKSEIILHGDLVLNQVVEFRYDSAGGAWQLLSPLSQKETYHAGTAGRSSNAYVITISPPGGLTAAVLGDLTGKRISFIIPAAAANTGATLLTVTLGTTTLTAKPILKNGSLGLNSGDLAVGQLVEVVYDGSNFQMTSHLAVLYTAELAGHAKELYLKRASATTISIGTSGITGSIANFDVVLKNINNVTQYTSINTSGFTINTATAAGVGVLNTLDTGTLGTGWYYIWIVSNGTTTGGVLSLSNTTLDATNITNTYPYIGLVGIVYSNAGSLTAFTAIGRKHYLQQVQITTASTSPGTISGSPFNTIIPPIAKNWWGTINDTAAASPTALAFIAGESNGLGRQALGGGSATKSFAIPLSVYSFYYDSGGVALAWTFFADGFEI